MLPFGKNSQEKKEQDRLRELREKEWQEEQKRACAVAQETVYSRSNDLGFPTMNVDVRFYIHLFGLLLDYRTRIEELEQKLNEKEDNK
jgi:hypothetical protein